MAPAQLPCSLSAMADRVRAVVLSCSVGIWSSRFNACAKRPSTYAWRASWMSLTESPRWGSSGKSVPSVRLGVWAALVGSVRCCALSPLPFRRFPSVSVVALSVWTATAVTDSTVAVVGVAAALGAEIAAGLSVGAVSPNGAGLDSSEHPVSSMASITQTPSRLTTDFDISTLPLLFPGTSPTRQRRKGPSPQRWLQLR